MTQGWCIKICGKTALFVVYAKFDLPLFSIALTNSS